jgi:hypothetical protein
MSESISQPEDRLSTRINSKLILSDPLMIASSHWTDNEKSFHKLASFKPSAITLKTISEQKGGAGIDGASVSIVGHRTKVELRYPALGHLGYYVDGPPEVELWDLPSFISYAELACKILPTTKIGLRKV